MDKNWIILIGTVGGGIDNNLNQQVSGLDLLVERSGSPAPGGAATEADGRDWINREAANAAYKAVEQQARLEVRLSQCRALARAMSGPHQGRATRPRFRSS
jgi:hypothetical protein